MQPEHFQRHFSNCFRFPLFPVREARETPGADREEPFFSVFERTFAPKTDFPATPNFLRHGSLAPGCPSMSVSYLCILYYIQILVTSSKLWEEESTDNATNFLTIYAIFKGK